MTPSFAIKKGVRYRYYVSSVLAQGRKGEAGSISRIASQMIESLVLDALGGPENDAKNETRTGEIALRTTVSQGEFDARASAGRTPHHEGDRERNLIEEVVERVVVRSQSVEIHFHEGGDASARPSFTIPWLPQTFRRNRELIPSTKDTGATVRPIRVEARRKLLAAIAKGRQWLANLTSGAVADIETIAVQEGLSERSARMTMSLAFLAPDIVQAAVDGTLPRGFGVSRLTDLPAEWTKQRQALGLPASS
jgi:site-specific DNA recombinase